MPRLHSRTGHAIALAAPALALLHAIAPLPAGAQVTLQGQIDAFAGFSRPLGADKGTGVLTPGGMQTNFWALRGTEDLGSGLKAVFALEAFYRADSGAEGRFANDAFFARSAYVGLSSGGGTLQLGRNTTPYWLATIAFNPYAGSFSFSPAVLHSFGPNGTAAAPLRGDSGWSDSLLYTSPSWGGFTARLQYSFEPPAGTPASQRRDADKHGASLSYAGGAFAAALAYQSVAYPNAATTATATGFDRQSAWLLGGSYDLGMVKLFAQYQRLADTVAGADRRRNSGQFGLSIPAGPGAVLASYGHARTSGAEDARRNTWAVGYDYPLSKRTDIYLNSLHDRITGTGAGSGQTWGLGLRHYF